jgi:hypothetical protein
MNLADISPVSSIGSAAQSMHDHTYNNISSTTNNMSSSAAAVRTHTHQQQYYGQPSHMQAHIPAPSHQQTHHPAHQRTHQPTQARTHSHPQQAYVGAAVDIDIGASGHAGSAIDTRLEQLQHEKERIQALLSQRKQLYQQQRK